MFLGEFFCFVPFIYISFRNPEQLKKQQIVAKGKGLRVSFNRSYFAIPAICDLLASTCNFIGLTMATASTSQIMSAATIFFTAVLSYFFLKRRYTRFQMLGILMLILGIVIVGTGSILDDGNGVSALISNDTIGGKE